MLISVENYSLIVTKASWLAWPCSLMMPADTPPGCCMYLGSLESKFWSVGGGVTWPKESPFEFEHDIKAVATKANTNKVVFSLHINLKFYYL